MDLDAVADGIAAALGAAPEDVMVERCPGRISLTQEQARRLLERGDDPGMRAHRLSTEVVRRWTSGKTLGTPSLYNVVREVLVEEFDTVNGG